MPRYTLAAASLVVSLPALAQTAATESAVPARPAAPIRTGADALLPGSLTADSPLDDAQLARRLSLFYERQSELFDADAAGDEARYARILDELVADLHQLSYRPGILFEPRFRDLYAAVLGEYERHYDQSALDRGDVYEVRAAGIAAVETGYDAGAPLLEHVTLPDLGTYATTIPMDVNTHVDRYVQFLVNRRGHVDRLRERADTYFPMVERVLAEEGVPDELKYLAMVESALNPVAQSHAGAAGMWQFIRATGAAYGLQATREVDDRLDPEQATRAAARHLRDLHDRFGDWQLALAGYNCNPAVIARAVRRFEERTGQRATFWDIMEAIPRETRAYVPMFIATTLVVSNPEAYGISSSYTPGTAFTFDRLPVEGGTRLSEVARALDISESVLRALNPSLRAGRVPTGRSSHMLRIPVGHASEYAEALSRFAPRGGMQMAAETVRFGPRAVRPVAPQERGEAVQFAAARQTLRPRRPAEAPVARQQPVARYSPSTPPQVAAFVARQEAAPPAVEAPAVEAPVLVAVAAPVEAAVEAPVEIVTVAAKDTPEVTVEAPAEAPVETAPEPVLVAEATEAEEAVEVEQAPAPMPEPAPAPIRVAAATVPAPAPEEEAPTTSVGLVSADLLSLAQAAPAPRAERPAPRAEAPRPEAPAEDPTPVRTVGARATTHTVARGETLYAISRQYGVSVSNLRAWNSGVDGDRLLVGQTIRLTADGRSGRSSSAARTEAPATRTTGRTHTVRSGETLSALSARYGVTIGEIRRANGITGPGIRAGQTLRIPDATRSRSRGSRG